jgi:hypothetical protein
MPHVGTRQAGVSPERVPKPVAGRAFTVVRTARPLRRPTDPGRTPLEPSRVASRPGFCPLATVASRADAVGALPARNATAPRRTGRLVGDTHP